MTEAFQTRNDQGVTLLECFGTVLLGFIWSAIAFICLIPGSILGAADNFCSSWRSYRESKSIARSYRVKGEMSLAQHYNDAARHTIRSLPRSIFSGFFDGLRSCCYLALVSLPVCTYVAIVDYVENRLRSAQS